MTEDWSDLRSISEDRINYLNITQQEIVDGVVINHRRNLDPMEMKNMQLYIPHIG